MKVTRGGVLPWKRIGWTLAGMSGLWIVVTLSVPNYAKHHKANTSKANADILALSRAVKQFAFEEGHYPESLLPLVTPDENGDVILDTGGIPRDPWGREYLYDPPSGSRLLFNLRTLGSDGAPGGSGDAQDLDLRSILAGKP